MILDCGGTTVALGQAVSYERLIGANTVFLCAMDTDGEVHCSRDHWGKAVVGSVQDAAATVDHGTSTVELCVVDSAGEAWCYDGEGGHQPVSGSGFVSLAGDVDNGCVLDSAGAASCWGSASMPATYASITGKDGYRLCGITASGALDCWFYGYSYRISDSGPWDWVDLRNGTICAGDTAGATYCWQQSSGGTTPYGVSGNWSTFSGQIRGATTSYSASAYGCGVLATGGLRCVTGDGHTIDHEGSFLDAVWLRSSATLSNPPLFAAVTSAGEIVDLQNR